MKRPPRSPAEPADNADAGQSAGAHPAALPFAAPIPVKPPPPGTLPAPGYIVDVFDGSAWLTADGQVTDRWAERGIWPTPEEAAAAIERAFQP